MKTVRSLPFRALSLLILAALLTASTVFAAPAEEPAPPTVTADAAVVMDYDTGEVLYAKDADEMRVPASMTKVMTAYLIFEELEAGNLTLDTMVPISAENAKKSRDPNYPAMVALPSGGQVSGLRSNITRSARLPARIEPFSPSSKYWAAALIVTALSAS